MIIMTTLWHYYCAQVRSCSILVRVYVSHHHENKGPPAFCIPILDVHGLHRVQSRWVPDIMFSTSCQDTRKVQQLRGIFSIPRRDCGWSRQNEIHFKLPILSTIQLFLSYFKTCITAVISFYRLLSLTKTCKRLKIEKTSGPRVNWALESVPSRAHSEFSALLCSFNSQEKFVQGRICSRSGPRASPEHYQLVHRKCGVSHLFTEHYSCPPF